MDESKPHHRTRKRGWVTYTVDATLRLTLRPKVRGGGMLERVHSFLPLGLALTAQSARARTLAAQATGKGLVGVGLLKSYNRMGYALAACEGGCTCTPGQWNTLHGARVSQAYWHWLAADLQADQDCVIAVGLGLAAARRVGRRRQ